MHSIIYTTQIRRKTDTDYIWTRFIQNTKYSENQNGTESIRDSERSVIGQAIIHIRVHKPYKNSQEINEAEYT